MQKQISSETQGRASAITQRILRFVLVYGLWIISSAIIGLAAFYLLAVIEGLLFLRVNPWQLRAIRRFGFIIVGMVWLGYIIAAEWHCRTRFLNPNTRTSPLFKYFAIESIGLAVIYGLHVLING